MTRDFAVATSQQVGFKLSLGSLRKKGPDFIWMSTEDLWSTDDRRELIQYSTIDRRHKKWWHGIKVNLGISSIALGIVVTIGPRKDESRSRFMKSTFDHRWAPECNRYGHPRVSSVAF